MARLYICQNFCWNLLPIGDNKLAEAASAILINGNGIPTYTPIVLYASILAPAPAPFLAPTVDLTTRYLEENF